MLPVETRASGHRRGLWYALAERPRHKRSFARSVSWLANLFEHFAGFNAAARRFRKKEFPARRMRALFPLHRCRCNATTTMPYLTQGRSPRRQRRSSPKCPIGQNYTCPKRGMPSVMPVADVSATIASSTASARE
jgi:hypothetical protein